MRNFAYFTAVSLLAACSDEHSCTLAACGSPTTGVALVDETGQAAAARGEVDVEGDLQPFDCVGPPTPTSGCANHTVNVFDFNLNSNSSARIRFQLPDGSMTPWQAVALTLTRHDDPDFNGPGCPCTWYSATAEPVVVPESARVAREQ